MSCANCEWSCAYWRVLVDEDEEEEGFIVDVADVVGRIEGRGKEVWEGLWW